MAYQTFNGWTIIPTPSFIPKQIDIQMIDTVGVTASPFTLQSQTLIWPGADYWMWNVSYPPIKESQTGTLEAFFAALRGKANVFQLGNPRNAIPQGQPAGTPVAAGVQAPMSTFLNTRGWTANRTNLLLPGDHIQIGYRLHMVAQQTPVQSDGNGSAQIEIWPSLRESPTDGQPLVLVSPQGLFRLADNVREWTSRETKTIAFSFKAVEAR